MTLDVDLVGNSMQMAVARLRPNQVVYCEAGKFLFSSGDVTMTTRLSAPSTGGAPASPGGLGGLVRGALSAGQRMLAGESLAYQHFQTAGGDGLVAFAGVLPGEMRVLELDGSTTWFAERDAFIAAEAGVDSGIAFSGLRQGLAGGEGFILQSMTAEALAHALAKYSRRGDGDNGQTGLGAITGVFGGGSP